MKLLSFPIAFLLLLSTLSPLLRAAPDQSSPPVAATSGIKVLRYKMISGFKQAFEDDLRLHLSKGWTPVGGVSVTTWNNALYFAQLLSRPSDQ